MKKVNFIKLLIPIFVLSFNFISAQNSASSASIDIEWQAIDSYIPNFYEGRALPGEEGYIKAIAIVNANSSIGQIDSNNLYYSWKYNDYIAYNYSGTGSNTIYFTLDKLQSSNTLELYVYTDSSENTLLGSKTITINPNPGFPILYKKNDNSILTYSNALNKKYESLQVNSDDSFNIIAEPFFFSAKNIADPSLSYSWTSDGVYNGNNGSNLFSFSAGSTNSLNLKITHSIKTLQEGETTLNFSLNN